MDAKQFLKAQHINYRLFALKSEKQDLDKGAKISLRIATKCGDYPSNIDERLRERIVKAYADEIESLEKEFKEL